MTVDGQRYAENVDVAMIDHFIDQETTTGKIDPTRIYLIGWSNGAAMAYAYGLSRPRIAAIAVYSAPDPYKIKPDGCFQKPVAKPPASIAELQIFNLSLPTYQVHNTCDLAGICPKRMLLEGQLRSLGVAVSDTILDDHQNAVAACDSACGTDPYGAPWLFLYNSGASWRGITNHMRWPNK
jgi:pimeloyl-ACP methyl ester carboxylesterase